jgi:nicotinamide-nucleotide amidase
MTIAIEKFVKEIGEELKRRGLTLTTAESCTGGGLSYWLTSIPGSSTWFDRGFVTYSDAAKSDMLGVFTQTLEAFGAVSEQTAREMAQGALHKSRADISVAVTGIAGPDGGSIHKPVGTVWIAWMKRGFPVQSQLHTFSGDRYDIRIQSIETAFKKLLLMLKGTP